ncbi:hypothetical protein PORY_002701, partial [Pneumocystis oryctolagi]
MSNSEFERSRHTLEDTKKGIPFSKKNGSNETKELETNSSTKIDFNKEYDGDLYSNGQCIEYDSSIPVNAEDKDSDTQEETHRLVGQYTAPKHLLNEFCEDDGFDPISKNRNKRQIVSRESDYQKRRFDQILTPSRHDAFSATGKDENEDGGRSFADIMRERDLEREEERVHRAIAEKKKEIQGDSDKEDKESKPRKRRWDVSEPSSEDLENKSSWSSTQDTPVIKKRSRWDQTPAPAIPVSVSDTATPKKSRWDQTPVIGITPIGLQGLQTPLPNMVPQMPISFGTDVSQRFYDFSDEELDEILPVKGFKVLDPPPGYAPIRTPVRKLMATPSLTSDGGFTMQEVDNVANKQLNAGLPTDIPGVGDLAFFKQEDMKYFESCVHMDVQDRQKMPLLIFKTPAPSSLALSVICLKADFLIEGVPFLILSNNRIIFRSFNSSTESSDSSVESMSFPKYFMSSCLKNARSPTPGISVGNPALSCLLATLSTSCIVNPPSKLTKDIEDLYNKKKASTKERGKIMIISKDTDKFSDRGNLPDHNNGNGWKVHSQYHTEWRKAKIISTNICNKTGISTLIYFVLYRDTNWKEVSQSSAFADHM